MIVTKTPFRITLGGGGTDLPSFYRKHGGMIVALGLDKHMFISVHRPKADTWVRLHHAGVEKVQAARELRHELAREALLMHGIHHNIEISALADFPAGTGLGSSSCYLVGLLNAVRALNGKPAPPEDVAEEACRIELDILKKPIGKQDQYMAALGGLTYLDISRDGKVEVRSVEMKHCAVADLVANTHLYYTGVVRDATDILVEQNRKMLRTEPESDVVERSLLKIRDIGYGILDALQSGDLNRFGLLCDEHWQNKLKLSSKVAIPGINEIYEETKTRFGVLGGKIAGAGGGGFLMLYCPGKHLQLTEFMEQRRFSRVEYALDYGGSRVIAAA